MEKPSQSSAIQLHQAPSFGATKGKFAHLPNPPLRFGFVGVSQSGKGVAMLDLLLRHYRGCFERIYLFSPTAFLDKSWLPLIKYVEGELGVDSDKEKWMFEEFDTKSLQEQVDLQMKVAELAKKRGHKNIPQVLWIIDDHADDDRIMHSNHNIIASLAIKSRHFGGNLFVATQKYRALANIIRVNLTALFVWPAPNSKERKAIIEELAGHYSEKDIEEMLQHISRKPYAFLFADLKAKDPDKMFMDSLTSRIRVRK
jgi:hypothetical protein